jgi:uncharacterized protein (DUF433 family)
VTWWIEWCIRGYRFSVEHLLELLAASWTLDEIQAEFSFIELEDVQQALGYAAALARNEVVFTLAPSKPIRASLLPLGIPGKE